MKKIIMITTLIASLAQADIGYQGTSIGAQVGIFGIGGTVKSKISDTLALKAGFDTFSINDYEVEDDTTKYNFDLKLQDFTLVGDYHPWAGSFKLSGGLIVNNSTLDGDITPNTRDTDKIEFDFNGVHHSYQLSELGSIQTKVDFDPVAPYVGFGWDTSFDKKEGFGFTFDLGVAYQGAAQATYKLKYGEALDVDKQIAKETQNIPEGAQKDIIVQRITTEVKARQKEIEDGIKADLDAEMLSLQEELDKYKWMPYIAIGFNYKF